MILIDAGPLAALFDEHDEDHELCVMALDEIYDALWTTWPVLTETLHFLGKNKGWRGQKQLFQVILDNEILVAGIEREAYVRIYELMEKYRDTPMDLADASLVALAEKLDCKTVFTLDSDFRVYRFRNRQSFKIIP